MSRHDKLLINGEQVQAARIRAYEKLFSGKPTDVTYDFGKNVFSEDMLT